VGLVLIIWLTGRVLGVRRGLWRSVLSGAAAFWLAIELLGWELDGGITENVWLGLLVLFGTVLLLSMVISLVLDALLPALSGGRGGLRGTVRRVSAPRSPRGAACSRSARQVRWAIDRLLQGREDVDGGASCVGTVPAKGTAHAGDPQARPV
jgi:hypothetical protein